MGKGADRMKPGIKLSTYKKIKHQFGEDFRKRMINKNFSGADLRHAYLKNADLSGADLRDCKLQYAKMQGCNLYRADLRGAKINSANLRGANLSEANMENAYYLGANLRETCLEMRFTPAGPVIKQESGPDDGWEPEWLPMKLFRACMFAKKMISQGTNIGLAHYKAGQYYGYSASDVAWARNQLKQPKNKYSDKR
jgi:uncharacterized protein YjbI with pentapeptide repeats